MKRVVVIGAGPSGLLASIYASYNDCDVTILERNHTTLKKLLLTGNGKCNYYNDNQDLSNYNSDNRDLISKIINEDNLKEIESFFDKIGLVPKIKNGLYYPCTNLAVTVKSILLKEAETCGVRILTDFYVENIKKKNDIFIINENSDDIEADVIIISTGSKAYPKSGSDGNGYELLKSFNHTIIEPKPSLVQLVCKGQYFKELNGIRCDVKLKHYENNKFIKEEQGELQLTDYGLSGICVFNLSGRIKKGLSYGYDEKIYIDFLPNIEDKEKYLIERNNKLKNRTILELLEGIVNYKLVKEILKKYKISENISFDELNNKQIKTIIENLSNMEVSVVDTKSFDNAQVCSGGVPLNEINLETMESKLVKDLYIVGEIIDIDGLCGGYNLTNAWITGMLAGRNIKE